MSDVKTTKEHRNAWRESEGAYLGRRHVLNLLDDYAALERVAEQQHEVIRDLLSFVNRSAEAYWKPRYANTLQRAEEVYAAADKLLGKETT